MSLVGMSISQNDIGIISLLQNSNRGRFNYVQIGRGMIDLTNQVNFNLQKSEQCLKGLIYGTRTYNFDKIVAKFTYKFYPNLRRQTQIQPQKGKGVQQNKQKLLKSQSLQNRIQQLPRIANQNRLVSHKKSKNHSIKQIQKPFKVEIPLKHNLQQKSNTIANNQSQKHVLQSSFLWFYEQSIEKSLKKEPQSLISLHFTNIKLYKFPVLISKNQEKLKLQTQINHIQSKEDNILISIFSTQNHLQLKNMVMQIIVSKIQLNEDNQILKNIEFYCPKQRNFSIQIIFFKNQKYILAGQFKIGSSRTKIVELYNNNGEESGFFIIETSCSIKQKQSIEKYQKCYQKQKNKFTQARKLFKKSHLILLQNPLQLIEAQSIIASTPANDLVSQKSDQFLSNYVFNRQKLNYSAKRSAKQLLPVTLQRSKSVCDNQNEIHISKPRRSLIKKQYLPTTNAFSQNIVTQITSDFQKRSGLYTLKISRMYLNSYFQQNNGLIIKFTVGKNTQMIQQFLGQCNAGVIKLDLHFKEINLRNQLVIEIISLKKQNLVSCGQFSADMYNLFLSKQKKYKGFLENNNTIVGYILFDYNMQIQDFQQTNGLKIKETAISSLYQKHHLKTQ